MKKGTRGPSHAQFLAVSQCCFKKNFSVCNWEDGGRDLPAESACVQASKDFEAGIRRSEHLEVVGQPEMSVVAFKARNPKQLDIFGLNDLMSKRGWHFSALQLPSALHMCFTAQHVSTVKQLLEVRPYSMPQS